MECATHSDPAESDGGYMNAYSSLKSNFQWQADGEVNDLSFPHKSGINSLALDGWKAWSA